MMIKPFGNDSLRLMGYDCDDCEAQVFYNGSYGRQDSADNAATSMCRISEDDGRISLQVRRFVLSIGGCDRRRLSRAIAEEETVRRA